MSTWHEAQDDEIDVDATCNEVGIFVCSDDNGGVYLSISFDQIIEIAEKIERIEASMGLIKNERP